MKPVITVVSTKCWSFKTLIKPMNMKIMIFNILDID